MEALQGAGNVVGEYVGDGQGEFEDTTRIVDFDEQIEASRDADWGDDSTESMEVSNDDSTKPLLLLYDCESTGLSIYNEHIIEIAAEVVDPPASYSNTTFTSLVKTARSIPSPGTTGLKKCR